MEKKHTNKQKSEPFKQCMHYVMLLVVCDGVCWIGDEVKAF